jgi:Ricin-type beta-trefoil lectin domain
LIRSLIVAVALFVAIFLISALGAPSRSLARPRLSPPVVHPSPARPGVIPDALPVRLSGSQLATAARRCAAWAAKAGFPNTGLAHGRLTTAVAVALAETGCDPAACYDNSTRRPCIPSASQPTTQPSAQPATRPTGRPSRQPSRDAVFRGAWQVGGQARTGVSDTCAYQGLCNARAAYRVVAGYGTDLRPWSAYLTGRYQHDLAAAAHAVSILRQGALPSAVTGMCAAYVSDQPGAWAWLAACGRGSPSGEWNLVGQQLRTGSGLCLTASTPSTASTASAGPVTVERCTGSNDQDWLPGAAFALTNVGTRLCLTAPGSPAPAGTTLTVQRCAGRPGQRWFRP